MKLPVVNNWFQNVLNDSSKPNVYFLVHICSFYPQLFLYTFVAFIHTTLITVSAKVLFHLTSIDILDSAEFQSFALANKQFHALYVSYFFLFKSHSSCVSIKNMLSCLGIKAWYISAWGYGTEHVIIYKYHCQWFLMNQMYLSPSPSYPWIFLGRSKLNRRNLEG